MKNAVATFKEFGVLQQKSVFLMLSEPYRADEKQLTNLLEQINQYRCHASVPEVLSANGVGAANGIVFNSAQTLRRNLMVEFPFMAKL